VLRCVVSFKCHVQHCPFLTSLLPISTSPLRCHPHTLTLPSLPPSIIILYPSFLPPSTSLPYLSLSLPPPISLSTDHTLNRCPSDDSLTLDGRENYQSSKTEDGGAQINPNNTSAKHLFENIIEPEDGVERAKAVLGEGERGPETGQRVYSSGSEAFGDVTEMSNTGRSDSTLTVAGGYCVL
jgi:hypothetical protein